MNGTCEDVTAFFSSFDISMLTIRHDKQVLPKDEIE